MMPVSLYTNLGGSASPFTDKAWKKAKSLLDNAIKTGLGASLTSLQAAFVKAKDDIKLLDVGMLPTKLRTEEEVEAAKTTAQATLAGSKVKALIAALGATATVADAAGQKKLS
ncbi:MAG: hypothetical protein WCL32_22635, partial [Planctomycetota bacterium]